MAHEHPDHGDEHDHAHCGPPQVDNETLMMAIEARAVIGHSLSELIGHYAHLRRDHPAMAAIPFTVDKYTVEWLERHDRENLIMLFLAMLDEFHDQVSPERLRAYVDAHVEEDGVGNE